MPTKRELVHNLLTSLPATKRHKQKQDTYGLRGSHQRRQHTPIQNKEDAIVDAIDNVRAIKKYADLIEKLERQDLPVEAFLSKVSPSMAVKMLQLAECAESEKVQFEAVREILALAGYTKIQKVAVANVDPNADKTQLKNIVDGLAARLPDIEIIED